MIDNIPTTGEPSVTSLVGGIMNDAQELFRQQIALFKAEFREDMRKTWEAALSLVVGMGVALIGGIVLAVGLALMYVGKKRFESFHPLSDQSALTLKENVQWITNRK